MSNREQQLADSLGWIVEFCLEHAEWFGLGESEDGSEFEWLENAQELLGVPVAKDS